MPLPSPQANNTTKCAHRGRIFPTGGALHRPYINEKGTAEPFLFIIILFAVQLRDLSSLHFWKESDLQTQKAGC